MIHKKIYLPCRYREKQIKNNQFKPFITTYILDNSPEIDSNRKQPLVLLCPGGGYYMTSDREAEPIALKLNALGFHVCVLRYSIVPFDFPAPILDLCEAMELIKTKTKEWHIDNTKIILGGCSAGGHLAAFLGIYWNSQLIQKYETFNPNTIKPNGLLLCYPVITANKDLTHGETIKNILGEQKDNDSMREMVSLEKHVNKDTPPTFIWHTWNDDCVPVENSLLFATALRNQSISTELHIFAAGPHGLSLASKQTAGNDGMIVPECQLWPELFALWAKAQFT
ncbi:MAG: acetylesterase [Treponema sp. CETP13]|nr:MAG: acetylesterase [Treponema sp. CETP13]